MQCTVGKFPMLKQQWINSSYSLQLPFCAVSIIGWLEKCIFDQLSRQGWSNFDLILLESFPHFERFIIFYPVVSIALLNVTWIKLTFKFIS